MSRKGIDVSVYQGNINWNAVKNSGIDFAIIRSGYGKDPGQQDRYFLQKIINAKKAGIYVGVYHYSYASSPSEAIQEAEYCLSITKSSGIKLDLPIYYDIEYSSIINNQNVNSRTQMCISFCTRIENAGYWAGVYSNLNWFRNYLNESELKSRYSIWLAQYNSINDMNCDIWQYTSSGSINGINGDVDLNTMYRDLIAEIPGSSGDSQDNTSSNITYYTVQSGDSLSEIAESYGISYSKIAELNNIENPDLIYPGQVLIIPLSGNSSPSTKPSQSTTSYTVKSGDTLSEIAESFGVSYSEIAALNNIENPDLIYAGQVLIIPSSSNSVINYTVESGDTLWDIAEKYLGDGSRYKEIQSLNNLTSDIIYPGQILKINK